MRRVAAYSGTLRVYRDMMCAAKSLLKHTRMDAVYLLIEHDAFPWPLPDIVKTINVSGQKFFDPEGPNYKSPVTYMDMIRLALPEVLPDEDRVLWLDIDTIVCKDISPLLDMDLEINVCAMTEEPVRHKYPFKYYNAGVCLFDLDKLRQSGRYKLMIDLINREAYTAQSQDMINIFCQGEVKSLGPEWNMAEHITQHHNDPYIRHFAGSLKSIGRPLFDAYEQEEWSVKDAE